MSQAILREVDAAGHVTLRLTPLHMASTKGSRDLVSLLLEAGAQVNPKDAAGDTPAQWAQDNEFVEVVAILQSHGGRV